MASIEVIACSFAEFMESDEWKGLPFAGNAKRWITEKLQKTVESVTSWSISRDLMDNSIKNSLFKTKLAGPYCQIKLEFDDGSVKYGRWLVNDFKEIEEEDEENWRTMWVRVKESKNVSND